MTLEQAIAYAREDQRANLTPEANTGEATLDAEQRVP